MKREIHAELIERFSWPVGMDKLTMPLRNIDAVIDRRQLLNVAAKAHLAGTLALALLSHEYVRTGLMWISAMRRLGWSNILIVACDPTIAALLDQYNVPNVRASIDDARLDRNWVTPSGFSPKGTGVTAFKFPVARLLIQFGFNVFISDVDALWLRDPLPFVQDADVAFQRVAYHPDAIAKEWGFAACSGFVWFRAADCSLTFVERCIDTNLSVCCDQVAMNLALYGAEQHWNCQQPDWWASFPDGSADWVAREAAFARVATWPITGTDKTTGARLLALPHDKFWRHAMVSTDSSRIVICHPNSPHDDTGKIAIFDAMGLRP
jgi:hypothetical protein